MPGGGGGKKQGGGDSASAATAAAGDGAEQPDFNLEEIERPMAASVDHLQHQLAGVRTGRANPGLLESIPVEAYGEKLPLKACGTVTVRSPQMLAVSVFDSELVSSVVRAIQNSPLSLAPSSEGGDVLVKLPRMTKETIEQARHQSWRSLRGGCGRGAARLRSGAVRLGMVKLVSMEQEAAHQSIRHARQRGMDAAKKAFKGASEDDRKRAEKEVQKLHDRFIAEADRLRKAKESELREHRD